MELPFQGLVPVVIGVTGHRDIPAADIELLTIATRSALTGIEQSSLHSPHIMLTSLAEGGGRITAKVAIGMGWMVGVVLPAPVELYALDFKTAVGGNEPRCFSFVDTPQRQLSAAEQSSRVLLQRGS